MRAARSFTTWRITSGSMRGSRAWISASSGNAWSRHKKLGVVGRLKSRKISTKSRALCTSVIGSCPAHKYEISGNRSITLRFAKILTLPTVTESTKLTYENFRPQGRNPGDVHEGGVGRGSPGGLTTIRTPTGVGSRALGWCEAVGQGETEAVHEHMRGMQGNGERRDGGEDGDVVSESVREGEVEEVACTWLVVHNEGFTVDVCE